MIRVLANTFPINERSGLNIANKFNEHQKPKLDSLEAMRKSLIFSEYLKWMKMTE